MAYVRKRTLKIIVCMDCGRPFAAVPSCKRYLCERCDPLEEICKGGTNWRERKKRKRAPVKVISGRRI